jgi:hypothetical protein
MPDPLHTFQVQTLPIMRIPIEIMLRGNNQVFTESLDHPVDAGDWTEADAATVLKGILLAISRTQNPGSAEVPDVVLRGVNWIVHPGDGGVVIALEIHSASAVAGPIAVGQVALDTLISRAVTGTSGPTLVH